MLKTGKEERMKPLFYIFWFHCNKENDRRERERGLSFRFHCNEGNGSREGERKRKRERKRKASLPCRKKRGRKERRLHVF